MVTPPQRALRQAMPPSRTQRRGAVSGTLNGAAAQETVSAAGREEDAGAPVLRLRAEAALRAAAPQASEDPAPVQAEQIQRALHELRVHQTELEMQNEELRRAQAELSASQARYFDLYNQAPAGYLTLGAQGLILEANLAAVTLLGVSRGALLKQAIRSFVLEEDQDIYYHLRKRLYESGEAQSCELRLARGGGAPCWVSLVATLALNTEGAPLMRCVLVDVTERKLDEQARQENAEQLSALTRRLLEVQEEERAELARELHDEVGQVLTAVRLHLKVVERGDAPEGSIGRALKAVEVAIKQVRSLSLNLRSPLLDELGLAAALRSLAQQYSQSARLRVSIDAPSGEMKLPRDVTAAAYRIAQEALTNAIRHAHARETVVCVEPGVARLVLTVSDDGCGFAPEEARRRGGFGLRGMEERAKLAGGTLRVRSEPGKGTQVRAEFRLEA